MATKRQHRIYHLVHSEHRIEIDGVNLKEEGKKLRAKISGSEKSEAGVQSAYQSFGVRATE